jgi:hypothetical protein
MKFYTVLTVKSRLGSESSLGSGMNLDSTTRRCVKNRLGVR